MGFSSKRRWSQLWLAAVLASLASLTQCGPVHASIG
jgi:hypothetical protein